MKRGLPILPALLLITSASLFAQGESGNDQAVTLAHKFSAGQTARYKIVQNITGSRTFPGSAKPAPIDAQLVSIVRIRCDRVLDDGTANISIELESGALKIGKRQASAFSAGSAPRMLQVTPGGKVTFPPQEQQVGDGSVRRALTDSKAIEPLVILAGLPDQPVAPGGAWSADVALPSLTRMRIASTLKEVKVVSGERAAVITQTQTTSMDSPSPSRQDAQSKLIFGLTSGRLLWAEGSIHSVTDINESKIGSESEPSALTLDSKYTVERLKG